MKSASLQYANALADVALAQGAADAAVEAIGGFCARPSASPRSCGIFWRVPPWRAMRSTASSKKSAARLGAGKIIRNFLFVIADNQRTHVLPEIMAAFQDVIRQRQGIAEAEISSAVELSAAQKKRFAQTLERLTGKKIQAKYSLDPALLGGAVVRMGDTIYDGSVRNRLNEMRARLVAE